MDKRKKSKKSFDSDENVYRTRAQERISDDEIAIAARKCFVTCNTILSDTNFMMIK